MTARSDTIIPPITGHTQVYAVLGHPIGHTLSPLMHNASFRRLGLDAVYLAFDVLPAKLATVLPAMRDMGFRGVNLTVPLKEVACRILTVLDESAARLGAVNTVEFLPDGTMKGHNTDGRGFLMAIEEAFHQSLAGRSIFVLGTGGAGRAVAITAAMEGASTLKLADIDSARAHAVGEEIRRLAPRAAVEILGSERRNWTQACSECEFVIQATPVGMKPEDESLLGPEAFRDGQCVFDLVYMFPETAFMRVARNSGARTANGLGMLLYQGAYAFTIWTGMQADIPAMRQALEEAVYGSRKTAPTKPGRMQ